MSGRPDVIYPGIALGLLLCIVAAAVKWGAR
jgi:hypothetical protein